MIFKTHAYNIPQIAAALRKHDAVWFHGDGNMYPTDKESLNHRNFVNPKQEEATYRYKFTSARQLPPFINGSTMEETERLNADSVDKLNEMLMSSRNTEIRDERKSVQTSNILSMDMHEDLQPKGKAAQPEEVKEKGPAPLQIDPNALLAEKMKALDDKMALLESRSKELEKRSAEIDKKAAELNKKAGKGTAAGEDSQA